MKLTISQSLFADTLAIASHAVAAKSTRSILSSFILHCSSQTQKLSITAFNLSLGIRAQCNCNVEEDGTVALPALLLEDVVTHLPKSDITLEIDNNVVILTHQTGRCLLQIANAQDFPTLPEVNGMPFMLAIADLRNALKSTLLAASRDEAKLVLAGVYFKLTQSTWEAAATDGHRLAITSGTIAAKEAATGAELVEATVPLRSLIELEKILSNVADDCTVSIGSGIAVFDLPNVQITSRLLDGQYPNYSPLIPNQFQYRFITDRKALDSALRRTSIVAEQRDKVVKITFDPTNQRATLCAESSDVGGAVEVLSIQSEGVAFDNLEIGFSIKYLLDAIKFLSTEKVLFEINSSVAPTLIKPFNGTTNQLTLVMPMNLSH